MKKTWSLPSRKRRESSVKVQPGKGQPEFSKPDLGRIVTSSPASLRGPRPCLERASSRGDWPWRLPRRTAALPPSRVERFPGRNLLNAPPGIRPTSSPKGSPPSSMGICPPSSSSPPEGWTPLLLPHTRREPPPVYRTQVQVTDEPSLPTAPGESRGPWALGAGARPPAPHARRWAELGGPGPGVGCPIVTSLPSGPGRGSGSVGRGGARRWQLC
ncbi:proline-rich receptor-like protein kinase PERK8 [Camelus ferus]|uniref:Proline-rich receptor-like protein kinase PERK8 n=1 Tax=Camelus ferus TaxID=419612 RepID=A0A8B8SH47_CAMFR|nr:proline-rich receptor-like protein kinase PERK8 [Camelus ferus]